MCFSAKISLLSFVYISLLSLYVIRRGGTNDKWLGTFFLFVAFIQLFEAFIWISLNKNLESFNYFNTVLLYILIGCEPLILTASSLQSNEKRVDNSVVYILMGINFIFLTIWLFYIPTEITRPNKCKETNCRLLWPWKTPSIILWLWFILLLVPILYLKPTLYQLLTFIYIFASYLFAYTYFKQTTNSIFCWISIIGITMVLLLGAGEESVASETKRSVSSETKHIKRNEA